MCNSLGIQLPDMLSDAPFTSAVLQDSAANCLSFVQGLATEHMYTLMVLLIMP